MHRIFQTFKSFVWPPIRNTASLWVRKAGKPCRECCLRCAVTSQQPSGPCIEDQGRLQGCVAYFAPLVAPFKYFPEDWSYLRFLAVHPQARGQGHARPLMEWCIEKAAADGAPVLGLHTSKQAGYGYQLYERLGFQEDQDLPDFQGIALCALCAGPDRQQDLNPAVWS